MSSLLSLLKSKEMENQKKITQSRNKVVFSVMQGTQEETKLSSIYSSSGKKKNFMRMSCNDEMLGKVRDLLQNN